MSKTATMSTRRTIRNAVRSLPLVLALVATSAWAQSQPCSTPEHRRFDFWIGDWDVRNAAGRIVGRNAITVLHKGCVLMESWTGAGGVTGSSFNIYDTQRKQWHQTWVDSSGSLLELDGTFLDGAMVLSSAASGSPRNRITWRALPDGRVRQLWETSSDDGATWTTSFDGYYEKRAK